MAESITALGLAGMRAGFTSAAKHAETVTSFGASGDDGALVEGFTGLKADEVQVAASAKVVKVGQDLSRAVLDIVA